MNRFASALAVALACAVSAAPAAAATPAPAPTPASTKYYVDGKRIPPPGYLPPRYPEKEFRRRIGGTAVIAYAWNAQGRVTSATVKTSSGNKNLDAAAIAAVKGWTIPPPAEGQVVAGAAEAPITFTPN